MHNHPYLAQKLFNRPLAIHPDKLEVVIAGMADHFGIARMFREDGGAVGMSIDPANPFAQAGPSAPSEIGYDIVGGVAVIPIWGTLVQRLGTLQPFSGMTGYDGIRQNFIMAFDDPDVDAIAFDIDSGGGDVAGCFDLVDLIAEARGRKPLWAILAENAYSAAYALASPCDVITVPRTGGTGNVGVIYTHVDTSGALTEAGLTVTLITDGDLKADGSDVTPLSDRAYRKLKADVQEVGGMFRQTVARNRGMSPRAVKNTQAGTFLGRQGVDVGFADFVMAPDAAMRRLQRSLN